MEYKPKKRIKNALIASLILVAGAIACIVLGSMGWGYKWLSQLLVFISLTALLFIAVRYVITDFVYTVSHDGYLEVKKISSKIPVTMASVEISGEDIIVKEQKDMSSYGVIRKERFNVTMGAEELYWYIFTVNGEKQALILECEPAFVTYLQGLIEMKRSDGEKG